MFSCRAVSVEYYLRNADEEAHKTTQTGRDRTQYYVDSAQGEPPGVISTPQLSSDSKVKFRFAKHGTVADASDIRAWARGQDPVTEAQLVDANKNRKMAYDCTFSAPKTFSLLWAASDEATREALERAQSRAVETAMQWLYDNGLIVTRLGKGGKTLQPVADFVAARFRHHTSRAGDVQIHDHVLIMNMCQCEDGRIRTLDNQILLKYQKSITNLFRAELARTTKEEMAALGKGVYIVLDDQLDQGWHVVGVPSGLVEQCSKRTRQVEDWLESHTGSSETAGRGGAKEVATLSSRGKKGDVAKVADLDAPGGQWDQDFEAANWTRQGVCESVAQSAARAAYSEQRVADEGGVTVEAMRTEDRRQVVLEALDRLEETEAALGQRAILKAVFEASQGVSSIEQIEHELDAVMASGRLVEIGRQPDGERVFASPELIGVEREMLAEVQRRQGERVWAPSEKIEQHIRTAKVTLSKEQADAVRHAFGPDGVPAVEGSPGAGKSTTMSAVANCARDLGYHVWAVAPSHKAKGVIAADIQADESSAKALSGFVARLTDPKHKDHISLSANDVVILDEAGMCSLKDVAALIKRANGAKIVLSGDTRQLQPVQAGSPMQSIIRLCGTSRINEIIRQDVIWQREAAMKFSKGKGNEGLDAYDAHGQVVWADTREEAIKALCAKAKEFMQGFPNNVPENRRHLSPLIVPTTRNKDVKELNAPLREVHRELGLVRGPDITVTAFERGDGKKRMEQPLAEGDRLIFGESLIIGGVKVSERRIVDGKNINNSDFGTVLAIREGSEPGNPWLRVRLDSGAAVEGHWLKEFVGFRNDRSEVKHNIPKIVHAYACTIYASQGASVAAGLPFDGCGGFSAEEAAVALTRHRVDCTLIVDTSAVRQALIDRHIADPEFSVHRDGTGEVEHKEDAPTASDWEPSLDDIQKVYKARYCESKMKSNPSSYAQDINAYVDGREQLSAHLNIVGDETESMKACDRWFLERGLDLSEENMRYAEEAHKAWVDADPKRHTFGLDQYILYTQEKHAADIARRAEAAANFDDSRAWNSKSGPWHLHDRLPSTPELDDETVRWRAMSRLTDAHGFVLTREDLARADLPEDVRRLAEAAEARRAAAEAAADAAREAKAAEKAAAKVAAKAELAAETSPTVDERREQEEERHRAAEEAAVRLREQQRRQQEQQRRGPRM